MDMRVGMLAIKRRKITMIGFVTQDGHNCTVRDEKGNQISRTYVQGQLIGFTGATFSVRDGHNVTVYDEKGHQVSRTYVG